MKNVFLWLFVALSVALTPILVGSAENFIGEYKLVLRLQEAHLSSDVVRGSITLTVKLPSGHGSIFIPIPVRYTPDLEFYIEPASNYNTVLFGHIKPDREYAALEISLLETPSSVEIYISNCSFEMDRIDRRNSAKAIQILLMRSIQELKKVFPNALIPNLIQFIIDAPNFIDSSPPARLDRGLNVRLIDLNTIIPSPPSVVIFLGAKERPYIFYCFMLFIGLCSGMVATRKFVKSSFGAKIWLICAILGLLGLMFTFFRLLTIDQILYDTTTIFSIGLITGIDMGIMFGSLAKLRSRGGEGGI